MRKVKRIRILVIVIVAALIIQTGFVAYSMIGDNLFSKLISEAIDVDSDASTQTKDADNQLKDETSTEISQNILDFIKSSDPNNYTKSVENYKQLLKDLNVHLVFKNEIERLIKNGKKLPDILTAYAFLNDCYGNITDLEKLVDKKESGKKWLDIFIEYNKKHPEFVPRNFETGYLEKLSETPGIDQDSIMIADRVSQNTKNSIDNIINKRVSGLSWRLINAQYGIVNGQEKSPHLSVTSEQLKKYTKQTELSEKQVVEALAIGNKLGKSSDDVLKLVKQGLSKEAIYSKAYEEKYY